MRKVGILASSIAFRLHALLWKRFLLLMPNSVLLILSEVEGGTIAVQAIGFGLE
jgi:hypothetical protein